MTSRDTHKDEGNMAALLWDQIIRVCGEEQLSLFLRPTDWKDEEKRVYRRVPCCIPVDYATREQAYTDFIRNISVGGAFIESRELPLGPEITMVFSLHEDDPYIKLRGEVASVSQRGIGVKFKLGR